MSVTISCTCFTVSRNNKVPSQCDCSGYVSPSQHLTGHWLEAAGFGTDTAVTVTVEHGQLLMRIVAE
ncbi:type I addiction module toxin, SymE family [Pectobacterium odoriferum]|nr:type I addiction module toxin, SymE family [Pectobacterium odoriferum]MCH5011904.1 type I addiction module toxin, SymE family [Pectobacterium odoriferum]